MRADALFSPTADEAAVLLERTHPVRLTTMSYAIVSLYPLSLAVAGWLIPGQAVLGAYLAFAVYSVGMSGVNVTWNMGSIAFAPDGQGGYYQGIHVAMVGIRGFLGPAIGFTVLKFLGYTEVFGLAAGIFLIAALSSGGLDRKMHSETAAAE